MNAVVAQQPRPKSVLVDMSTRYGMEPAAFEATLRATVCKGNVSKEEFAAFLLVAKEHRLNPVTKEIYAFPAKGGGIQPIVSIDGWARIINEHPQCDGVEFEDVREGSELIAVTCRIYRKDRTRPTMVTEYLSECRRQTDVWKQWPARMLRHKALIQAARYAFGFSGIVDPDEYERMTEIRSVAASAPKTLHAGFAPALTDAREGVIDVTPTAADEAEPESVETARPIVEGMKTGAQLLAEQQRPTLADRALGLETSLRNAPVEELDEAWDRAADLRAELDRADPERLAELEAIKAEREEALGE